MTAARRSHVARPHTPQRPGQKTKQDPILVVSAFEPELAPLRRRLTDAAWDPRAIVCEPVGIGAIDAAVGAAGAIARVAPRLVIFIGTAGAYGRQPPIARVAVARHILLASTAVARGDGYLPAPLVDRATTNARLRAALVRAARIVDAGAAGGVPPSVEFDVAAPLAITRGVALARRLAAHTGAAVENLEVFAVARAALAAGVPFAAVLGISNRVGPGAHLEWRRHQAAATESATAVVAGFLKP